MKTKIFVDWVGLSLLSAIVVSAVINDVWVMLGWALAMVGCIADRAINPFGRTNTK